MGTGKLIEIHTVVRESGARVYSTNLTINMEWKIESVSERVSS